MTTRASCAWEVLFLIYICTCYGKMLMWNYKREDLYKLAVYILLTYILIANDFLFLDIKNSIRLGKVYWNAEPSTYLKLLCPILSVFLA